MKDVRKRHPTVKFVFNISIDGPSQLHNKIRGTDDVWAKALTSYKILKGMPFVKPQFGFTLSHGNIGQFENTFLALKDEYPPLRLDDITVNIFQRSSFYYDNQRMPALDPELLVKEIRKIIAMDKEGLSLNNLLRRKYLLFYLDYLKTKKSPLKCQAFSATCFLDPYGNLWPCAVYKRKLLNIRETDMGLKEIWKMNEAKQIAQECSSNKCPGCWSPCDANNAIAGSLLPALFKG
jgi:radical SAM protein with 4Fe4S-binding SPASM domain